MDDDDVRYCTKFEMRKAHANCLYWCYSILLRAAFVKRSLLISAVPLHGKHLLPDFLSLLFLFSSFCSVLLPGGRNTIVKTLKNEVGAIMVNEPK